MGDLCRGKEYVVCGLYSRVGSLQLQRRRVRHVGDVSRWRVPMNEVGVPFPCDQVGWLTPIPVPVPARFLLSVTRTSQGGVFTPGTRTAGSRGG